MATTATTTVGDAVNWTKGAYNVYLGPWGAGSLVRGKDYWDTATFSPDTFPNALTMAWSWPEKPATTGVYNFNTLDFGNYSYNLTSTVAASQVKDIGRLTQTHNLALTGDPAKFDVITDFWLTRDAGDFAHRAFEVEVAWHIPAYGKSYFLAQTPVGTYTDAQGQAWTVTINKAAAQAPAILIMPKGGTDLLSGTVDLKGMLDWLTAKGVITGTEYFNGLAMGSEVRQGSGSLVVNNFAIDYGVGQPAAAPPVIDSNGGGASAALNVVSGTAAVTTVHAIDANGTAPNYSIKGGADAALFTIDAKTGALAFKAAPSFAAPKDAGSDNVYNVTVQASDGSLVDTQDLAVSVKADPNAPVPGSSATYALTSESYDAQWRMTSQVRQTEVVSVVGAQQTVQLYAQDGTLVATTQVSTVGAKDTITSFDANAKRTGTDVVTHGAQAITDHYDAVGKFTSRDIFTVQDGKGVEKHYDASFRLLGYDVVTPGAVKDVVQHYDANGTATGYDNVLLAGGKLATQHYDTGGHFLGAESVTLAAVQATNHDPMTAWILG